VHGGVVAIVAVVGVVVNVVATWLAGHANRTSLNVKGVLALLVTDIWAFVASLVAGLVVLGTGWSRADAVASLLVAALMAWTGMYLVRAAGRVFLEAAPKGVDPQALGVELANIAGVAEVHDLHVWVLGSDATAMSAHVLVRPDFDCHEVAAQLRNRLAEAHGLEHVTLQVDHEEQQLHDADTCAEPHGSVFGVFPSQP
jgi:cobalt-zinc-cadmium efflux system protein